MSSTTPSSASSDLRGGLFWIALGAVVLIASARMDRFETMGGSIYTAPGLVPALFGGTLLLLGLLLCWRARPRGKALRTGPAAPLLNARIAGTLVLTLGYAAVLLGRAPFALSTALFVAVFTAIHSDAPTPLRRYGIAILAGVLTAAAVVLVFERLFFVRLP
ncbi:tripartite tricarboxylate transporter TctB family protein [Piscinibacter sakaiensis]|uniref:tripartite tricarboxylate transporter TctB family protein n=1 Tax=Piscinibacter sakaiensis TaxID=1547922 RepID=UPI003AADABA9